MASAPPTSGLMRIGELSRRHGVSPDVLRVWERRYGLLNPERTQGGFRLYTARDDERVRVMRHNLDLGYTAAVAARMALRTPVRVDRPDPDNALDAARGELMECLEGFKDIEAQAILDKALAAFSTETVLRDVVLPYLRELGDRWESGDVTIAQEHFASSVLRGRLMGLARGFDVGPGPRALLACPSGEGHDLGLLCFGIGLRERGWRVTFLGADTPIEAVHGAAEQLQPDLVVLCAEREGPMDDAMDPITALAGEFPVALAGRAASAEQARAAGARLLQDAPMAAAARIASGG